MSNDSVTRPFVFKWPSSSVGHDFIDAVLNVVGSGEGDDGGIGNAEVSWWVMLYVMYLCHKMKTMYYCEDYMDCHWFICLELELLLFCCLNLLYVPYFGGSPSGEAAKTWIIYIKNQYIPRLTEEHIIFCFSVNRVLYGHVAGVRVGGRTLNIFVGYV
jgi:hypothetical protein